MDEIINEIKQLYINWYNSNIHSYGKTADVLYNIGEILREMK